MPLPPVSPDAKWHFNGNIHFLGQDNHTKVQHDLFAHVMPLMLVTASHDADNIISHTIALSAQDDLNKVQHDFLGHMTVLALAQA